MQITLHANDLVVALLALLGATLSAAALLALLVRVAGRSLPEIEERLAAWLLVDAESWRARSRRRVELAGARPVLEAAQVEDAAA